MYIQEENTGVTKIALFLSIYNTINDHYVNRGNKDTSVEKIPH
jgi:hypothetical protein